jgi:hypothetical protein
MHPSIHPRAVQVHHAAVAQTPLTQTDALFKFAFLHGARNYCRQAALHYLRERLLIFRLLQLLSGRRSERDREQQVCAARNE